MGEVAQDMRDGAILKSSCFRFGFVQIKEHLGWADPIQL